MNANQFNLALRNFASVEVPKKIQEIHQKVAMEALRSLVMKTRVKTGRARGNWQVENNRRPQTATMDTDQNGSATIQKGAAVVSQAQPFTLTYITNNVNYIVPLEDGRGSFAGDHMMARTIEEIRGMFR